MLFYELYNRNLLSRPSGGHRVPVNADYGDVLAPLSEFFTKVLNIQIGLFGYQFKLIHFVLFSLFMIAIKVIWNYATKVM